MLLRYLLYLLESLFYGHNRAGMVARSSFHPFLAKPFRDLINSSSLRSRIQRRRCRHPSKAVYEVSFTSTDRMG